MKTDSKTQEMGRHLLPLLCLELERDGQGFPRLSKLAIDKWRCRLEGLTTRD